MRTHRTNTLFILVFLIPMMIWSNELLYGPYLQDAQPTQITIHWESKEASLGKVLFGTDSVNLSRMAEEKIPAKLHSVLLDKLSPHQTYYYQCLWEDQKSPIGRFKSAPDDDSTPFRIAFVGDSRSDLEMCTKISNLIVERDPAIVVHTGDIVASGKKLEQWDTFFFTPVKNMLQKIPFYPVLGNHEQESPHYYNYFSVHKAKPWWSVDYGSVHLIGLDTNLPGGPGSEQYKFLVDDLERNKKKWIIVAFHHPLFNSHPTRESSHLRRFFQPLFMKHGVDLVITGHDHYYHRSYPIGTMSEQQEGVIHITTAGGGASLYPNIPTPYSAYHRSLYHFLQIDVTEEDLIVRAINEDNSCFDAIVINKQNEYPPEGFVEYEMFELEKRVHNYLGHFSPKSDEAGYIFFDTIFTVPTNFFMPVKGEYSWEAPEAWDLETLSQSIKLTTGGALQINLQAKVNKNDFLPTPILKLHLEADNSTRNVIGHRPYQHYLGFINQKIEVSLEEAAYRNAILVRQGDPEPILHFLDYYSESRYAYNAILALGYQILQTQDRRILDNLKVILQKNPSDLNKFRIYPFYFLFNDFSILDEWIAAMGRLPSEQLSFAPKLICKLTDLDNFNARYIKNWNIAGPFLSENENAAHIIFAPEKDQALDTSYQGPNNTTLTWNSYNTKQKTLDFIDFFSNPELSQTNAAVFAQTTLSAERDGEILLLLGSDDDPVVWVNGEEIFRKDIGRGVHACSDIILANLKKGKNNILIKIAQRGGGWGLMLKIADWQKILN